MGKIILDATCGMRSIWFQKHEPHTIYCDRRKEIYESNYGTHKAHRKISIDPDILCDFKKLPFDDNTFSLVVFDPPHLLKKDNSWIKKMYGYYEDKAEALHDIGIGICECMRVLKIGGTLIFKWNELDISTREIIEASGYEPLFGHRSGKKSNTHWLCFMKFDEEESTGTDCAWK